MCILTLYPSSTALPSLALELSEGSSSSNSDDDVNGELLSVLKCYQFIIILSSITADSVKTVSPAAVNHTLVQALMDKITVDGQSTVIMTIH